MKRGTPDHPKTKHLIQLLGIARYEAVGILESLWHFAANYAKRGDIGKWSNREIAAALDWRGDPEALIEALTEAHWLDPSDEFRLTIHDWPDHADQTVQRCEEVKKLGYASKNYKMLANASQPMPCQCPAKANAKADSLTVSPVSLSETISWGDFDWATILPKCRELAAVLRNGSDPLSRKDRSLVAKTVALDAAGMLPPQCLAECMDATKEIHHGKPAAYFTGCLKKRFADAGLDFPRVMASVKVPSGFGEPAKSQGGGNEYQDV